MIKDLTINHVFSASSYIPNVLINVERPDKDEIVNELVLTGTAEDRDYKRYYIKYHTCSQYCDCCGRYLDVIPWHFREEWDSLCDPCKELHKLRFFEQIWEDAEVILGTLDDHSGFVYSKPWSMPSDSERELLAANPLFWD